MSNDFSKHVQGLLNTVGSGKVAHLDNTSKKSYCEKLTTFWVRELTKWLELPHAIPLLQRLISEQNAFEKSNWRKRESILQKHQVRRDKMEKMCLDIEQTESVERQMAKELRQWDIEFLRRVEELALHQLNILIIEGRFSGLSKTNKKLDGVGDYHALNAQMKLFEIATMILEENT